MAIAAGEQILASDVQNVQVARYYAVGSGTVAGAASDTDVTDATLTFDTSVDGSTYLAFATFDVNWTGATTTLGYGRIKVDGAATSPLATWQAEVATDRGTYSQTYGGSLATAGSHTIKLVCSPALYQTVEGVNSTIAVLIFENV